MDRKEISIPVQAEKVLSPDKKLLPIKVTRIKLNFETGSWKEVKIIFSIFLILFILLGNRL